MAGSLLYIPYTIFIIVGLIGIGVIIRLKIGNRITKKFLIISIPIFFSVQFYFWNLEFNDYVKSYLFSNKTFVCEYYSEVNRDVVLALPKRTVFHGKQDVCSPIYSTYVSDEYFIDFYRDELKTMKFRKEIQSYNYAEQNDKKGFKVELSSGIKMDIFIESNEESDKSLITLDIQLNN